MFGSLKKKLQEGIKKLSEKVSGPEGPTPYPAPRETGAPTIEALKPLIPAEESKHVAHPAPEPQPLPVHEPPKHVPTPPPEPQHKPHPLAVHGPPKPKTHPELASPVAQPAPPPKEEKKSFRDRIGLHSLTQAGTASVVRKITERSLTEKDIDDFFTESETDLLQANVALPVIEFLRADLKQQLANKPVKRTQASEFISQAFRHALLGVVNQGTISLKQLAEHKKPLTILVLGFNGAGKTTTIAKIAHHLKGQNLRVVLAAGDTFRAASIEQLGVHADRLKIPLIKSQYGADSAAVIFDARKHAQANHLDVVLADTAGRTHVDKNLIDELKKIVRVNQPDLKVLVVDSLTGTDAVEQAKLFNDAVGVDAVVLTKVDVNTKGGAILSVCYAIKKPILYLGTGQNYEDIQEFVPEKFVDELLQ